MKIIVAFLLSLSILSVVHTAHGEEPWKIVIQKSSVPSSYSFTETIDAYGSYTAYGGGNPSYARTYSESIKLLNGVFTDKDNNTKRVYFYYEGRSSVYLDNSMTVEKNDYDCTNPRLYPYLYLVVQLNAPVVQKNNVQSIPVSVYCYPCDQETCTIPGDA